MYCPKCGARVENTEEFCYKCGQKIAENKSEDNTTAEKNKNKKHGGMASIAAVIIIVIAIVVMTIINETGILNSTESMDDSQYTQENTYEAYRDVTGAQVEEEQIHYTTHENDTIIIDYSDYGFENMYNMDTWLYIEGYDDFSDEPYVWCRKSGYDTHQYSNNYIIIANWGDNFIYNENDFTSIGETYQPYKYDIVNNDTIVYKIGLGEGTLTITERVMVKGAPILYCQDAFQKGETRTQYTLSMPTGFIDWTKSPEESTMLDDEGNEISVIKYYIK